MNEVEATGQIVAVWRRGAEATLRADPRAALHVTEIAELADPAGVVVLPGDVRYVVGAEHPRRPFTRYVHRL